MNVAVLGTGPMGILHASIHKSFKDVDAVFLVSRNQEKTANIAKEIGVKTSTFDSVLNDDSITTVDVCLPTHLHKEYVLNALRTKKHVLCEIPITENVLDAQAMCAEAAKQKTIFQVAQLMRSVAEVNFVVDQATTGALGTILSISAHRYHTFSVSDPMTELMAFELDTVSRIGGVPKTVFARETKTDNGLINISGVLDFNGYTAEVELKTIMPKDFPLSHGLRVVGTNGILETHTVFTDSQSHTPEVSVVHFPKNGPKKMLNVPSHDPYRTECRYFLDTILSKVSGSLLDARHAVNTLQIAIAVKKSIAQRNRMSMPK